MKTDPKETSNKNRNLTTIKFLKSGSDGYDLYQITENHDTTIRNLKETSANTYVCRYDQQFTLA